MKLQKIFIFVFFIIFFSFFELFPKTREEIVASLFRSVEGWFGAAYVYGGESKSGVDCSAFVLKVYKEVFNIDLPRRVRDQKKVGKLVVGRLQPGDLVFFNINGSISHIGIYVFDNKFIHAASGGPKTGVIKSSLNEKYYKQRYAFARRIVELPPYKKKSQSKKESISASDDLKESGQLVFGRVYFRGILDDLSIVFYENRPIYIKVEVDSKKDKKYFIKVDNKKGDVKKITLTASSRSTNVHSIKLPRGTYQVELLADNGKTLYEKNILVK